MGKHRTIWNTNILTVIYIIYDLRIVGIDCIHWHKCERYVSASEPSKWVNALRKYKGVSINVRNFILDLAGGLIYSIKYVFLLLKQQSILNHPLAVCKTLSVYAIHIVSFDKPYMIACLSSLLDIYSVRWWFNEMSKTYLWVGMKRKQLCMILAILLKKIEQLV